jgi:hypothetical protein
MSDHPRPSVLLTGLKANVLASISLRIMLVGTTTTAAYTVRRGPRRLALARVIRALMP